MNEGLLSSRGLRTSQLFSSVSILWGLGLDREKVPVT